nr:restriction endonuclease subunit S [uncultured Romboutsia sp.]
MKSLKYIALLNSGFQGRATEGNDYRIIKLKDVTKDGVVNYNELANFNSEKVNEKYILKNNDIIIKAKSGDNTAAIINTDEENVVAASHYIVIRVKDTSIIDPEYLVMYLNSDYVQNYFEIHREGSAIPIIKMKTLEDLQIKVIDIEKQKELAKIYRLLNEEKITMQQLIEAREKQFKQHLKTVIEENGEKNE